MRYRPPWTWWERVLTAATGILLAALASILFGWL